MTYAKNTAVPIDRSRAEIEATLRKYGADQFSYGVDYSRGMAVVRFRAQSREIQFVLYMPEKRATRKHQLGWRVRLPSQKRCGSKPAGHVGERCYSASRLSWRQSNLESQSLKMSFCRTSCCRTGERPLSG